jgi:hypothetical protein
MLRDSDPASQGEGEGAGLTPWARWRRWLTSEAACALWVVAWPFVFLQDYLLPFKRSYVGIANDFYGLYYVYKLHLLANLSAGHFPLWSPSEAGGYPFYSNPFTQAFYPLNLPLALWYRVSGGYGAYEHQLFTILGVSILALGLLKWLRSLGIALRPALLSALVLGVSFKVTETLRFPNAVHTACWYPWVLLALGWVTRARRPRDCAISGGALVFFLVCLCTGAYFYYLYYSVFLFVPYTLLLLAPGTRRRYFGLEPVSLKHALTTLVAGTSAAALLCAPYVLKVAGLMAQTRDRTGRDYAYSTEALFNFTDTIGSLVYPPCAQAEGWFFFGVTSVVLTGAFLLDCWRSRVPARQRRVAVLILVWLAVISAISYGRESYLFDLLWNVLPGFSSLRVWGRLNIVMVPLLAWMLALAYESFESRLRELRSDGGRALLRRAFVAPIGVYAVILAAQWVLHVAVEPDPYWTENLPHCHGLEIAFIGQGALGAAVVLAALRVAVTALGGGRAFLPCVCASLVVVVALELRPVGAHTWIDVGWPLQRDRLEVDTFYMDSLSQPRLLLGRTLSLEPGFHVGVIPNWYFERYVTFLIRAAEDVESRDVLLGLKDGRRLFISSRLGFDTAGAFLDDCERAAGDVEVSAYTGDELRCRVVLKDDGYLSFIDNWDPDWRVYVNGEERSLEQLLGSFKSVRLEAGEHQVVFSYRPRLLR